MRVVFILVVAILGAMSLAQRDDGKETLVCCPRVFSDSGNYFKVSASSGRWICRQCGEEHSTDETEVIIATE